MRLKKINAESSLGKGWARISFNQYTGTNELSSLAIVRPRHSEPYLGRHGWQISECRLPINLDISGENEFSLLLPPAVVQHMEVASNYEFIFFDTHVNRISQVIVRWSGISFRAPRGEVSPIDVIQSDDIPSSENLFGKIEPQPSNENVSGKNSLNNNSITEVNPPWMSLDDPDATLVPNYHLDTTHSSPAVKSTPQDSFTPHNVSSSRIIQRIKCRNPECRTEILDSMQICPFCQTLKN